MDKSIENCNGEVGVWYPRRDTSDQCSAENSAKNPEAKNSIRMRMHLR